MLASLDIGKAVPPRPTMMIRDVRAAFELAQREFERGRLREGAELLEQGLVLEPGNVPARTMLAIAYARMRRVERAFEHLERAVDLEPDGFGPQCALGELYLRLGVPERAHFHLDLALARATTPNERTYIESLRKEERARARRGVPRPNFRQPFWLLGFRGEGPES